jgi:enoyl-CoA hydratase/carnithine racemase
LSLSGRVMGAAEAREIGLVHHVAPAAELAVRAESTARMIAAWSAAAVRSGLEFVQEYAEAESARRRRAELIRGEDCRGRVRDFLRKSGDGR